MNIGFAIFNDTMVDLNNSLNNIGALDLQPQDKDILSKLIPLLVEKYTFGWEQNVIDAVVSVRYCTAFPNINWLLSISNNVFQNAEKQGVFGGERAANKVAAQLMDATSVEEFDQKLLSLRSNFLIEKDNNQLQLDQLIEKMRSSSDPRCMRVVSDYFDKGAMSAALSIWISFPTLYAQKSDNISRNA